MNTREIILKTLYDVEINGAYFNRALSAAIAKCSEIDRRFLTELVYGVTKNKLMLDYIISRFASVKIKKMSPWVHLILQMGTFQMYYMDKIPPSAACNESVKLAKKYAHSASVRFVNGVLRSIAKNIDNIPLPDKTDTITYLSTLYSYPLWMSEKLVKEYGAENAEHIMRESNRSHPVTLRVNTLKTTREQLLALLKSEGAHAKPCELFENFITVCGKLNITALKSYKDGLFSLQNLSSYRAAAALSPKSGSYVMDICAAPGGKSCAMAELMNNKGEILSFDIHAHKTKLIDASALRLGINIIKSSQHDGTQFMREYEEKADYVMLDAPCSGLGVIHKKPDIKWTRSENDITELAKLQSALLDTASKYLKIGGVLLYSTCTLLKEENENITNSFLRLNKGFEKLSEITIFPSENGESGFYICKLKRIA